MSSGAASGESVKKKNNFICGLRPLLVILQFFCFNLTITIGAFAELLFVKLFIASCSWLIIGTASVGGSWCCWRQRGREDSSALTWVHCCPGRRKTQAGCVWLDLLFQALCCLCSEQNLVFGVVCFFFSSSQAQYSPWPLQGSQKQNIQSSAQKEKIRLSGADHMQRVIWAFHSVLLQTLCHRDQCSRQGNGK